MAKFTLDGSLDALGLAELVRSKEVAPLELVEAAIARAEAINPRLNAIVDTCYDRARAQAKAVVPDGPFRGVPFLLKEIQGDDAGTVTTNGCRFYEGLTAEHDSELVRRHKAAGLIVIGKTNVPEFGLVPITEPELYGVAHNPWALDRTTGGSSGGSGAAVAARIVPMAHGNDGGGSIRIPASCGGVFGLKPTRGRNPFGPDRSEGWHGLVVEHALTVSVRDSAALLDATAGEDPGSPYFAPPRERPYLEEVAREPGPLKIGFTVASTLGKSVHPDCVAAIKDVAKLCESLGHRVEESEPPVDRQKLTRAFLVLIASELAAEVARVATLRGREARADELELPSWLLVNAGRHFSGAELASAVVTLRSIAREQAAWFAKYDVLLTPTLAAPPVRNGELQPKPMEKQLLGVLRRFPVGALLRKALNQLADEVGFEFAAFTPVANITGQPAMSVPLYWNGEGLPIGAHFVGRFGGEGTLFRLAAQLERARPWSARKPPGC
jgi:amidase